MKPNRTKNTKSSKKRENRDPGQLGQTELEEERERNKIRSPFFRVQGVDDEFQAADNEAAYMAGIVIMAAWFDDAADDVPPLANFKPSLQHRSMHRKRRCEQKKKKKTDIS